MWGLDLWSPTMPAGGLAIKQRPHRHEMKELIMLFNVIELRMGKHHLSICFLLPSIIFASILQVRFISLHFCQKIDIRTQRLRFGILEVSEWRLEQRQVSTASVVGQ